MKNIKFTAIIKDGGYKTFEIPTNLFVDLALAIQEKGCERLHTAVDSYWIVGILKVSKDVGDRVIVCSETF